jgi:hypothetical protein
MDEHGIPDAEKIKEILNVVSEKVPGLLKELSGVLYSPDQAKNFGVAVAIFYKELKAAGMSEEQAFELTRQYMSTLNKRGEGIRLAGVLIPSLIPLVFKLGKTYLRFKKDAQKAGKIFQKELRANGIDKETAQAMTEIYLNSSRILRAFDFTDFVS